MVAAHLAVQRADREAVALQQAPMRRYFIAGTARRAQRLRRGAAASVADGAVGRAGRARITTREPAGTSSMRVRMRWRSRRLTRLRSTAGPDRLGSRRNRRTCVRRFRTGPAPHGRRGSGWTPLAPRRTVRGSPRRCACGGRAASNGLRPTAWRDPCGGATPGSSGRRGCACEGGSRASWHDDGCSAGTYACSRDVSSRVIGDRGPESGVDGHRSPTTRTRSWARGGVVSDDHDHGTGAPHDGQTDLHSGSILCAARPGDTPGRPTGCGNPLVTGLAPLLASPRYSTFPQGIPDARHVACTSCGKPCGQLEVARHWLSDGQDASLRMSMLDADLAAGRRHPLPRSQGLGLQRPSPSASTTAS